jgi:DNA-binding PadR family transcriptional regulator
MDNLEITVEQGYQRFLNIIKPQLVPYLILYIINEQGKASSLEIKKQLSIIGGREISYQPNSYYRLMSMLEHEAELIEPVDLVKEKGPARIYYSLTPLGNRILKRMYTDVFMPIQKLKPLLIKD